MSKIDVFDITEFTDSDIITTIDVVKSFMYNDSIPIYEQKSIYPFINLFYDISNNIEKTVIEISKTESAHPLNAEPPIRCTLSGIDMSVMLSHLKKALFPIPMTPLGIIGFLSLLHL